MNSIIKTICAIVILSLGLVSCDKEDNEIVYGDLGEVTVEVEGDLSVVPATLLFTASAENAEFFVWDFGYDKDLNESDDDYTTLPMGNIGEEVELTFQHGGAYTVKVTAYNGNYKKKTREISINLYSFENDLEVNTTGNMILDIEMDACSPDNSLSFDLDFYIADDFSILDKVYVVRDFSSPILGDFSVTDTVETSGVNYNYTTQAALLESFGITESILLNDNDEVNYRLYAIGNNGETVLLDEVNAAFSVNIIESVTLPTGTWQAVNDDTGFTKEVTLHRPSPFRSFDDGRYWISDFGMDWSSWHDYWYTTEFKLKCPEQGDPRYIIDLIGDGLDTGEDMTDTDHTGTEVTKAVRIMPYVYSDAAVAYYDPQTQVITFENVPLTDYWWGADSHTVNLTFTFTGK